MEITSLVQEICAISMPEEKSLEKENISPSDGKSEVEEVKEVTDNSIPQAKSLIEEEEISPLVLDPDGKPLLNLQVMKKSKTLAKEPAKQTIQPKISQPVASSSQGVLVLTQGGKPALNLGKVKIGKNLKLESSKVVEKSQKQSDGGVDDIGQKKHSPLPLVEVGYPLCITTKSAKKTPYVLTVTPATKGQNTKVAKTSSPSATGTTKAQETKIKEN